MRRVSKTLDGVTTSYPTSVYSVTDGVSTVYVSGSVGLVASVKDDGTTSTTETIHTDHLGSTSVVTDEDGIMVELLDYDPYGTERISWSSSSDDGEAESHKTYIGEYSDDETGLSYLNARYYDPGRGQFLSQDAVYLNIGTDDKRISLSDPQGQNSYSYSKDNPIRFKDPGGECPWCVIGAGVAVFWNTVVDPALTAYSIGQATQNPTPENIANAAIDTGLTASPFPAGAGLLGTITKNVDGAKIAGKAADAVHSVYQSVKDGVVEYIGRTNDFLRRFGEHARNNRSIEPIDGLNGLTKDQARGAEQYLIETHGLQRNGGTLSNQINSVSPQSDSYQNLVQQGQDVIDQVNGSQ